MVNTLVSIATVPLGGVGLILAAGAASLVQSGVDAIESSIRHKDVSVGSFFANLGINFAAYAIGNLVGGGVAPITNGMSQPTTLLSLFTQTYGQRLIIQTLIGGYFSFAINVGRAFIETAIKYYGGNNAKN